MAGLRSVRTFWFLVGLFAVVVGVHDAVKASAGYQLIGVLLLILGIVACVSIVPALARLWWIVCASMSAALLVAGILVLGSALNLVKGFEHNWRLFVWGLVLAVIALSVVSTIRALIRDTSNPLTLPGLNRQVLTKALGTISGVGALIAAAYGFVWSTQLAPLAASPSFAVQGELHEVGRKDHLVVISGSIKIHNSSDTSISVLSSLYRVEAFKFSARTFDPKLEWQSPGAKAAAEAYLANRLERLPVGDATPPTLVQLGRIVPQAWVFGKGEDYNRTFIAYVPEGFDVAQLTVEIAGAKDTVLDLDTRSIVPIAANAFQESGTAMKVAEGSWFQRSTQAPRLVNDRWWFGRREDSPWQDPGYPTIDPCVYYEGSPVCEAGSVKFLGIVATSTQYEVWLKPA